jgi:flagellar basal body rod protein FlgG
MSAGEHWQEVVSRNLASASIPGYKRQDLSFEAVQAGQIGGAQLDPRVQFTLPRATLATSFSQGELRPTGVNTDVAIEGRGFFEVQLPGGGPAYTRDGEFHVNATGQLTTKQGNPVMGDAGPIQLDPSLGGIVSISATGEISQGGEVRGRLKVVDFEQPKRLTQIGGGLFIANQPELLPVEVSQPSLRQGFLEGANVSPATEMAALIGVMRGFEANQRLMQIHDERMGRVISELGNPS